MTLPGFNAEASSYRTSRYYIAGTSSLADSPSSGAVTLSYYPGPDTQARCSDCGSDCASALGYCSASATALLGGCIFPPLCPAAAAAAGAALSACDIANLTCTGYCWAFKCCPKLCGIPDPFGSNNGCCDDGEHCVDQSDPNSRQGCCPSNQAVCGGKCCAVGEKCCGDSCCPADFVCQQGTCCPPGTPTVCNGVCCNGACDPSGNCCPSPSHVCGNVCCPPFNKCCNGQCCGAYQECHPTLGTCWTPPHPPSPCMAGWTSCGSQCCPPGKTCCIPPGFSAAGCYEPYECIH